MIENQTRSIIVSDKVKDILFDCEWDDVVNRLVLYTNKKLKRHYWYGIWGGTVPGGQEAEDFVNQVITDLLNLINTDNPIDLEKEEEELFVSLEENTNYIEIIITYLLLKINKKIRNLFRKTENKNLRVVYQSSNSTDQSSIIYIEIKDSTPLPNEALICKETEQQAEKFVWQFYDYLIKKEDAVAARVVEFVLEGMSKPEKIAENLNLERKDIYNALKRLKRHLENYVNGDKKLSKKRKK